MVPDVSMPKFNMGLVHTRCNCNEMGLAHELFLESHRIYSNVYGPSHHMTVMTVKAGVCGANDAQRASQCAEESVRVC